MAKIVFTQEQQLDLTQRLQLLLLDAITASGPWKPEEIRFQGGTSLSLVHGSPRFSEDLDFLIGTHKGLNRMIAGANARMTNTLRSMLPGAQVRFGGRDDDPEADEAKNPRTFSMTVSHPDWYRVVKVKLEFWLADADAVAQYEAGVRSAQILTSVVEGSPLRAHIAPVLVNTAEIEEIVVDKLHALLCRNRMKHRDVFDLWWLGEKGHADWKDCLLERYENHQKMYADSPDLAQLPEQLLAKTQEVLDLVGKPDFSEDLKKWLGASSALATPSSADFIAESVGHGLRSCANELKAQLQGKKGLRS